MYRVLILLLCYSSLFGSEDSSRGAPSPLPDSFLSGHENLSEVFLMGAVNLYTGSFNHTIHILNPGITAPLPLSIHYNSSNPFMWNGGLGASFNHPITLTCASKKNKKNTTQEELEGGSVIEYTEGKTSEFAIDPKVFKTGITNVISGEISGRTNLKNRSLLYWGNKDKKKDIAKITDGSGTKRYYKWGVKEYFNILVVDKVEHPNGLTTHYTPSHVFVDTIERIEVANRDNEIIRSLSATESKYVANYSTSDGQSSSLFFLQDFHGNSYVMGAYPSHAPVVHFDFDTRGDASLYYDIPWLVESVTTGKGSKLKVKYEKGKVASIHKLFSGKKLNKLYDIEYNNKKGVLDFVDVFDINNIKIRYFFDKQGHLEKISRIDGSEVYVWGTKETVEAGTLFKKNIFDNKGSLLSVDEWGYDERGNVIVKSLSGNLTGSEELNKLDLFEVKCSYSSDGFNLPLSMEATCNAREEYRYVPETNLISAKFVLIDNEIVKREFYFYDKNSVRIETIIDDGSTDNPEDFSGITERRVQQITPEYNLGAPGYGLPLEIRTGYFDLTLKKNIWLLAEKCTYAYPELKLSSEIFGADSRLAYRLDYEYDDRGRLIRETTANGAVLNHTYDDNFQKISTHKEGSGFTTYYVRDYDNRIVEEREEHTDGTTISKYFTYDVYGNCIEKIDRYGNSTKSKYDFKGREIERILPAFDDSADSRVSIQKKYDLFGNQIEEIDALGNVTRKKYNLYGKPTEIIYPNGAVEQFVYRVDGELVKYIHKNGSFTTYDVDLLKRITKEVLYDVDGTILKFKLYEYNSFHLVKETDQSGLIVTYSYDGGGRLVRVEKEAIGNNGKQFLTVKTYTYDALGRQSEERQHLVHLEDQFFSTIKKFDPENHLIEEREEWSGIPLKKEQFKYDVMGNVVEKLVVLNQSNCASYQYIYDSQSQMLKAIDPLGNATEYIHKHEHINRFGHLSYQVQMIDPLGLITIQEYNTRNELISVEARSPNGNTLSNVEKKLDKSGNLVSNVYFIYDGFDFSHTYLVEWQYDSMNQPITEIEQGSKRTDHRYDIEGNILQISLPSGVCIDHVYNAENLLIHRFSSDNSLDEIIQYNADNLPIFFTGKNTLSVNRVYTPFGQIQSETIGDHTIKFEYDSLNRLRDVLYPDKSSSSYTYRNGRISTIERIGVNGKKVCYSDEEYDLRGNLLENKFEDQLVTHQWDPMGRKIATNHSKWSHKVIEIDSIGNLCDMIISSDGMQNRFTYEYDSLYQVQKEDGPLKHNYRFDSINNLIQKNTTAHHVNGLNQVVSVGDVEVDYNQNGFLSQKDSTRCLYDAAGRLILIEIYGKKTEYQYDPFNRRLSSKTQGVTEQYLYQGPLEIGRINSRQEIDQLRILRTRKFEDVGSAAIIELDGTQYMPLYDHRGNTSALIDSFGTLVESNLFSVFGERITESRIRNPWRFSSKREDPSKLIYFGERYYDPELARWITPDPLGFRDGPNLYAYLHGNPVFGIDPTGLEQERSFIDSVGHYGSIIGSGVWHGYSEPYNSITSMYGEYNGILTIHDYHGIDAWLYNASQFTGVLTSVYEVLNPIPTVAKRGVRLAACAGEAILKEESKQLCKKVSTTTSAVLHNAGKSNKSFDINKAVATGKEIDRNGLTYSGRAIQKHGQRPNDPIPKAKGNLDAINKAGQFQLEDIVTHPNSILVEKPSQIVIYAPDGRGVSFWKSNERFKGFMNKNLEKD